MNRYTIRYTTGNSSRCVGVIWAMTSWDALRDWLADNDYRARDMADNALHTTTAARVFGSRTGRFSARQYEGSGVPVVRSMPGKVDML